MPPVDVESSPLMQVTDTYLAEKQISLFGLSEGDLVTVVARPPKGRERCWAALQILEFTPAHLDLNNGAEQNFKDAPRSKSQPLEDCNVHLAEYGISDASNTVEGCVMKDEAMHDFLLRVPREPPPPPPVLTQIARESSPERSRKSESSVPPLEVEVASLFTRIKVLEAQLASVCPPNGRLTEPFQALCVEEYQAPEGSSGYMSLSPAACTVVTHIEWDPAPGTHGDSDSVGFIWFYGAEHLSNRCGWFPANCVKRTS